MKKFYKNRGFTIVEVLVAFVIFAIMAGMVSMILAGTYQVKQENIDLQDEIKNQQEAYFLSDYEKKYDSSSKDGVLSFNFNGITALDIDYNLGNPNVETDENKIALEYFIGEVDYDYAKNNLKNNPPNDPDSEKSGTVTSRLDSRVYGSTGFQSISVKMERDTEYTGTGYRYRMQSMASYNAPDSGGVDLQKWYAQYRFLFPENCTILSYGYYKKDAVSGDYKYTEALVQNSSTYDYEVYSPYSRTLRISSKLSTDTPGAIEIKYISYYVVLSSPLEDISPELDLNKIFGYTTSKNETSLNDGAYKFTPYEETITNNGSTSTRTYPNIFGAFPVEDSSTPGQDEPT